MSILNVNKINPVGGGSTITIAGIASVTGSLSAADMTVTNINSLGGSVKFGGSVGIGTTTTAGRNAGVSTVTGSVIFNSSTGVLEFYDGNKWVGTNFTPLINSISGSIFNNYASNIVVNTSNITATVSVRYSNNSTGAILATDTSATISASNITSSVPAAVYGNSVGTVIKIEVINSDGIISSNSLTRTIVTTPAFQYLVVAGGGGGGGQVGGGGGAGGMLTGSINYPAAGVVFTATVGAPGVGQGDGGGGRHGTNGANSTLSGTGLSVTSIGGGGGGGYTGTYNGAAGGSGGGAGNKNSTGGAGTSGQGNNGGNSGNLDWSGGGGGGAGAAGNPSTNTDASSGSSDGGIGAQSSITGTSTYYAGGGAGCFQTAGVAAGGQGGGGNGGYGTALAPTAGTTNLGGGGGGSRDNPSGPYKGANGGSGVVILRVNTTAYSGTTSGSPTVTTDGDFTVIKFTGNGSYTA